ncbi:MAG: LysR family transcriptional regulator [Bdellovibrionaceae bacterium]|nr:LysR family transcriptional regulator [Pseudobdellovibrionaceae bacterium]
MNLYHLKYFYDSARLGSITKAAHLNRVGQPAISKGIQNLEGVLGKTLISHARNRFQLTDDGEVIYSYCQKIFSATDEMKDALVKDTSPSGVVRVACPSSIAQVDFFTEAVRSINIKYPKVNLKLLLGRTDLVCEWLRSGEVDFGIVVDNVDFSGLTPEKIMAGTFNLIQRKGREVNWQEGGILTIESKREVQQLKQKYQSIYNSELKIKMEIGSWGVIESFVESGIGVGFVPDFMFKSKRKLKKYTCVDPKKLSVPYTMNLIRKADHYLPGRCQQVVSEFITSAKKH